MNNSQRKRLEDAKSILEIVKDHVEQSKDIVKEVREQEQEKIDNAPENLLQSERYQRIEECADLLDNVCDSLDEMNGQCDDIINSIDESM